MRLVSDSQYGVDIQKEDSLQAPEDDTIVVQEGMGDVLTTITCFVYFMLCS